MNIKSKPQAQLRIVVPLFGKQGGYSLTVRGVRGGDKIQYGRCTLRNVSSHAVASAEDKSTGEVCPRDTRSKIDDNH